jgi:signal transduction histidine kinase/CheY-like chemotaxis protein
MITIYDPEMKSFWGNRACQEILGWSAEEMAQDLFIKKVYPDSSERNKAMGFMKTVRPGWEELKPTCKDGSMVDSLWANIILSDQTQVGIGLDIREQKKAEQKLRDFNGELEKRVREQTEEAENRTMQLQMLAMQLVNAEDQERRRIAEILHDDLQQHLAAVKFALRKFIPYLKDDEAGKSQFKEIDQLIDEGIRKTRNLSHELVPSVLRHQGFLPAMRWMVREMKEKHGLEVELDLDKGAEPLSSGLATILYRCVRELLFNVLKHSGVRAAKVKISRRDDKIEITVIDGGRGCDPEQLRKDRKKGGVGLFSIEERMVYLGGGVDIDSAPGKGCKIVLNVPINAMMAGEGSTEDVEAAVRVVKQNVNKSQSAKEKMPSHNIRILLVDDHDLVREGIASVIEEEMDMEVVAQASDGNEAVFMAREFKPDVVLMDVSMPEKNGLEATREIKALFPDMPVIGLSMHEEPDICEGIIQAGATAYVSKTDSPEELIGWVRRIKPSTELSGAE